MYTFFVNNNKNIKSYEDIYKKLKQKLLKCSKQTPIDIAEKNRIDRECREKIEQEYEEMRNVILKDDMVIKHIISIDEYNKLTNKQQT